VRALFLFHLFHLFHLFIDFALLRAHRSDADRKTAIEQEFRALLRPILVR
jgi:hypothetical protein